MCVCARDNIFFTFNTLFTYFLLLLDVPLFLRAHALTDAHDQLASSSALFRYLYSALFAVRSVRRRWNWGRTRVEGGAGYAVCSFIFRRAIEFLHWRLKHFFSARAAFRCSVSTN